MAFRAAVAYSRTDSAISAFVSACGVDGSGASPSVLLVLAGSGPGQALSWALPVAAVSDAANSHVAHAGVVRICGAM